MSLFGIFISFITDFSGNSTSFDFTIEVVSEYSHEDDPDFYYYEDFDLVIAEVSNASTGMGIELGFFYDSKVPIYCIHKGDYSKAIEVLTKNIIKYDNIVKVIREIIKGVGNETRRI